MFIQFLRNISMHSNSDNPATNVPWNAAQAPVMRSEHTPNFRRQCYKHYGVILWNNRKSWVKVLIIKNKTQTKRRHNEKGLMLCMLVLPGYNIRHDVLLIRKITVWKHWNSEHGVNMSFCTEVDWVMHGSITTWPLTLSLSRFKNTSSSLEPSQPSYLAGISLELHLVAAWPYKPRQTGCEGPVKSMSARS